MDGGQDPGGEVGVEELAPLAADPERAAQQGLGGGRAPAGRARGAGPRPAPTRAREAGVDLLGVGLLVQAELAPALELEVLDDVGHVRQLAVDAGLQGLVEHAGRPDERAPGPVLAVPGCSPTSITSERGAPSPKTVWVASRYRSQAVHPAAADRRPVQVGPLGDQVAGRARRPLAGGHDPSALPPGRAAETAGRLLARARLLAGAHHPPFQAGRDQQQGQQHDRERGDDGEHEQRHERATSSSVRPTQSARISEAGWATWSAVTGSVRSGGLPRCAIVVACPADLHTHSTFSDGTLDPRVVR